MAGMGIQAELENPYKCKLTLVSPRGKCHVLEKIVSSVTEWVDPSQQIISIEERIGPAKTPKTLKIKSKRGCLVTPALSMMLFMQETGQPCARDMERVLKKGPWTFHHKVELQCKNAPNTSLAKQEFYKLADDLPLFVVCPVLLDAEHLRINIYVRNFAAMVEFYRLVTETEIETNKPEFCIFQIYRQPGLDIQLSLKRSQYIHPVAIESAYVSFNVKSIDTIRLNCEVNHVSGNVFSTRDPDGNLVVLYETSGSVRNAEGSEKPVPNVCECRQSKVSIRHGQSCYNVSSASFDDVKSLKSMTESHDSGRYSDIDGQDDFRRTSSSRIGALSRERTLVSEVSEGYASSEDSPENGTFDETGEPKVGRGKESVKGKTVVKKSDRSRHENSEDVSKLGKGRSSLKHSNKVAPVYL